MHAQAVPLQFSAERANENPLEKWTRVLVGEANTAARKAISQGWSSLSRVGKAAFDSFQGNAPASDVRSRLPHQRAREMHARMKRRLGVLNAVHAIRWHHRQYERRSTSALILKASA